ncbi:hypothetical protein A7K94_0220935, partial [Modestobacter sp. VKM Ac-2676]
TPTVPHAAGPPQGSAADGSTVGGEGLDTRGVVTAEGAPPLPEGIDAHGWLVADAGTGQVLGARDPHGRYYPASTIKTLTLLTLAPQLDPAQVVVATAEDEAIEGSRVGLVRDGQYPVDLLFRALVMQSGNDVANALARVAGGVAPTVAAMNATAARLGASDTVVGTPSGLDVAGQSSSPYDLALFLRELVADPYTLDVLQTRIAQMPPRPGTRATRSSRRTRCWRTTPGRWAARPASPTPPGTPSWPRPSATAAGWWSASCRPNAARCTSRSRPPGCSTGASRPRPRSTRPAGWFD